jgi:hypothetical protein
VPDLGAVSGGAGGCGPAPRLAAGGALEAALAGALEAALAAVVLSPAFGIGQPTQSLSLGIGLLFRLGVE